MRGNRFYKILEGKNLTDSFYKIISIELEENQLKEFQEFLVSIIDDVIKNIGEYPPIQEEGLVNKKTISELGETPFRSGAICYIPIKCEDIFYVVGDIHGDINSFKAFLDNIQFFNNSKKNIKIVFLGDYIDRGLYGLNVLLGILFLKKYYNEKIILLRGNHEVWKEKEGEIISTVEADNIFLDFWKEYFNTKTLRRIKDFFDALPVVLILSDGIILVHAGIPRPREKDKNFGYEYIESIDTLNRVDIVEEMLWSRPEEKEDVIITFNSVSFSFARKQFQEFMNKIGGRMIIRGHDPFLEGVKMFFGGGLVSIFSTGGENNETAFDGYRIIRPVYLRLISDEISIHDIFSGQEIQKIKLEGGVVVMSYLISQQPRERKRKGVADIVFCIDASGSMEPCIEGVKNHIEKFLDGVLSNPQLSFVDWRLGILAHDSENFYILDFTNDITRFKDALRKVKTGGQEFTLPALDWSLDFPWREDAHKIIVLFTDEPLEDGEDPGFQRSKMEELRNKIIALRCMVFFVGPECPEYREIEKLPRCIFEPISQHSDFYKVGFDKVLERIGKTISRSIESPQQPLKISVSKDIYGIKGRIKIKKI